LPFSGSYLVGVLWNPLNILQNGPYLIQSLRNFPLYLGGSKPPQINVIYLPLQLYLSPFIFLFPLLFSFYFSFRKHQKHQRIRRLKKQRKRTRNRSSRSLRRLKALPPSSPPPVKLSAGELTEAYSTVRFPGLNSLILFDF
jgi:hypothetical protein